MDRSESEPAEVQDGERRRPTKLLSRFPRHAFHHATDFDACQLHCIAGFNLAREQVAEVAYSCRSLRLGSIFPLGFALEYSPADVA